MALLALLAPQDNRSPLTTRGGFSWGGAHSHGHTVSGQPEAASGRGPDSNRLASLRTGTVLYGQYRAATAKAPLLERMCQIITVFNLHGKGIDKISELLFFG